MTATWQEAWNTLETKANLSRRDGQQILGQKIFSNVFDGGQLVAEGPTGVGKALDVSTPIPTPSGWKTMGSLVVGDEVYDENGTVCTVTKAHPVLHGRRCYSVEFSDRTSIVADEDHLWATVDRSLMYKHYDYSRGRRKSTPAPFNVVTTREIKESLFKGTHRNHYVNMSGPISGTEKELAIAPYTLGAWLGDGHSHTLAITGVDEQILSRIESDGYRVTKIPSSKYTYRVADSEGGSMTSILRHLNLFKNKHIPMVYLRSSYDNRLSLLQGLVDTDGTVSSVSGRTEIAVCSKTLALDILELVRSLGVKAIFSSGSAAITRPDGTRDEVGTRYRVGFTTQLLVASLPRKASLLPKSVRKTSRRKYITAVNEVESRDVRCIEVDSPNRLFLAGRGFTVTHNSFTALIPAICAFKEKNQRTILTTETISLLDQIVDKDLPFLQKAYGDFTYFGLKGRNHYLCIARAGGNHEVVTKVRARLEGTNGERRDVEKILGYRLDDEDWAEICGETEYCAQNRCNSSFCYSSAARDKAASSDIVITSHTMLQIHGEFIQQGVDGGLLGDFAHIIVDEAHSLERIVVDGSTLEVAPWELYQKLNTVRKGVDDASPTKFGPVTDELERTTRACLDIIKEIFSWQVGKDMDIKEWSRQSMGLKQIWINGAEPGHVAALDVYENSLPEMLQDVWKGFDKLATDLTNHAKTMEKGASKVKKAATACRYLSRLFWLVGEAVVTRTGTCEGYGTTFAVFADGYKGRDHLGRDRFDIRIRAVPLDVSQFLKRNLWKTSRSTTLISATLRDHTDGSFRFLKKSLGLDNDAEEVVVDSPFNFSEQMLIHLTDGTRQDVAEVRGARFSIGELKNLIKASQGRALVLFTSIAELEYVAEELRRDKTFTYTLLVQEKGVDKAEIAQRFKDDTHSVLLASKTFFQGFDVPGESLTSLILCKYSLPQYNATNQALIQHWKGRGFPKWYEMKSIETFVQAWGRLIRSDGCRGVVSLLDNRVADPRESIHRTVHNVIPSVYGGVEITTDVTRVKEWLDQ